MTSNQKNRTTLILDDELSMEPEYPYCRLPVHYFDRLLEKVRRDRDAGIGIQFERFDRREAEQVAEAEHRTRFRLN